jgi:hypothetical protein
VSQGSRDEDENGNDDEWELTTALRGRYAEKHCEAVKYGDEEEKGV